MNRFKMILFLIACFFLSPVFASSLQATVDRDKIYVNESFNLTITSEGQSGSPDWAPLKKDFDIRGSSQSTQFSIINGQVSSKKQWNLLLIAKKEGKYTLPALRVGNLYTNKIQIEVMPDSNSGNTEPRQKTSSKELFMEVSVSPKEVYVQEQITYTVKLYFRLALDEASLSPPEISNATITPLGQDIYYSAVKNGRPYRVLERSFQITPLKDGNYIITGPVIRGMKVESFDPMMNLYSSFANRQPIHVNGPAVKIIVKPKPANFNGQWWIPAKSIILKENWSANPPVFRIGQPITREIELIGDGVNGDQLPRLRIPANDHLNSYPEQPVIENKGYDLNRVGVLKQKIVYVPIKTGQAKLPEIKIPWWNTKKNRVQFATLPAKTITVLPAAGSYINKNTLKSNPSQSLNSPHSERKINSFLPTSLLWPLLAILFFIAWFITFLLWRRQKRQGSFDSLKSSRAGIAAIKKACFNNLPEMASTALLHWARLTWPKTEFRSLTDVLALLDDQELRDQINKLDRALYARNFQLWRGEDLWHCFEAWLNKKKKSSSTETKDPLPSLYLE